MMSKLSSRQHGQKACKGFLLVGALTVMIGFWVGRWTKVTTVRLSAPVSSPIRIAVLGDLHIGSGGFGVAQVQRALQMAQQQRPDIIVLLGDYVSTKAGLPYLASALRGVEAPYGVYAVLGNHDHWADAPRVTETLQKLGIQILHNESITLHKGQTRLVMVGLDDLWAGVPDWERAFAKVPSDVPVILLSHNPDAALHPMHKRAMLILSGHTHAGQIWTPQLFRQLLARVTKEGLIPATEYGQHYPYGLRRVDNTWVYVTSGITLGRFPPRWFTRPEVVIVEVSPEDGS